MDESSSLHSRTPVESSPCASQDFRLSLALKHSSDALSACPGCPLSPGLGFGLLTVGKGGALLQLVRSKCSCSCLSQHSSDRSEAARVPGVSKRWPSRTGSNRQMIFVGPQQTV